MVVVSEEAEVEDVSMMDEEGSEDEEGISEEEARVDDDISDEEEETWDDEAEDNVEDTKDDTDADAEELSAVVAVYVPVNVTRSLLKASDVFPDAVAATLWPRSLAEPHPYW